MSKKTKPRQQFTLEQKVAYHEAGHAAMAHALGMPIGPISTVQDKKSPEFDEIFVIDLKEIFGEIPTRTLNFPEVSNWWTAEDAIANENEIMWLLGGVVATSILRGCRQVRPCDAEMDESDWTEALALAHRRCKPDGHERDRETLAYLQWLECRTRNALKMYWGGVVALAEAVMGGKTLMRDQVMEIPLKGLLARKYHVVHENGDWEIKKGKAVTRKG